MEPLRIWGWGFRPLRAHHRLPGWTLPTSETSSVVVALVTIPKRLPRFTESQRYSGRGMSYVRTQQKSPLAIIKARQVPRSENAPRSA